MIQPVSANRGRAENLTGPLPKVGLTALSALLLLKSNDATDVCLHNRRCSIAWAGLTHANDFWPPYPTRESG